MSRGTMTTNLRRFLFLALLHVLLGAESAPTQADEPAPTAEHLEFFEKEVRPLLAKHCYQCHSVNAKRVEAKLLLDSRASQLRGGDSGCGDRAGKCGEEPADRSRAVRFVSRCLPKASCLIAISRRWFGGSIWEPLGRKKLLRLPTLSRRVLISRSGSLSSGSGSRSPPPMRRVSKTWHGLGTR